MTAEHVVAITALFVYSDIQARESNVYLWYVEPSLSARQYGYRVSGGGSGVGRGGPERDYRWSHQQQQSSSLKPLQLQISVGWPDSTADVPELIKELTTFADELVECDGLVFKGQQVVVQREVRAEMLNRIHSSHIGVNGCIHRAQESVFYPGSVLDLSGGRRFNPLLVPLNPLSFYWLHKKNSQNKSKIHCRPLWFSEKSSTVRVWHQTSRKWWPPAPSAVWPTRCQLKKSH